MKIESREIPQPIVEFIITLSEEEAIMLRTLTGNIRGHGRGRKMREFTDKLYDGLNTVESNLSLLKTDYELNLGSS